MAMLLVRAARITRPNDVTAYAVGDLLANSVTAGSVTPFTFAHDNVVQPVQVMRFIMRSSNDTVTNKNFQLYLFSRSPTVTNGDNGAFAVTGPNGTDNLGGVFGSSAAVNTGAGSINYFYPMDAAGTFQNGWIPQVFTLPFYGLLKVNAAYTPTALETFDLTAEVDMISYGR
ncbi:MAG: hypothetical protein EB072_20555 [Betaproteobacteria bacterium]|nr:hypothetical protein [Betaproteobacteria bacterium]